MIYSQIEVEPRSNITLVLKMAGLAILRREFFYIIKEEKEMNKFKATLSRLIMAAVWGVAITTLTSTSRYLTYQPKGEEELMRRYL